MAFPAGSGPRFAMSSGSKKPPAVPFCSTRQCLTVVSLCCSVRQQQPEFKRRRIRKLRRRRLFWPTTNDERPTTAQHGNYSRGGEGKRLFVAAGFHRPQQRSFVPLYSHPPDEH